MQVSARSFCALGACVHDTLHCGSTRISVASTPYSNPHLNPNLNPNPNPNPTGTYVFNASSCEECPSGYYAPTAQVDACLECDAGDHTKVASKATTCSACDGGTYSEGLAVNCSACSVGTASNSRASVCYECDAGKYSHGGAATCIACRAGTYQNQEGSESCMNCTLVSRGLHRPPRT
jgi:hypothetical protein